MPVKAGPHKPVSSATAAARAVTRRLLQTDLYALVTLLYRDLPTYQLTEGFHRPLCEYALTTRELKNLYLLPRNSFKTSVLTIARNVQRILCNPDIRILIASNKEQNAADMLGGIKAALQHDVLLWAFPDILVQDPMRMAEKWTEGAITVRRTRRSRGHTVEAIGETGELTSKHFHHLTLDDVVGRENTQSREMLLQTIQFVRLALSLVDDPRTSTVDYIGCLPASALVTLEGGTERPINEILVGERVWAVEEDGRLEVRAVTAMIPQGLAATVTVETDHHSLRATPNHPFLVEEAGSAGWVRADALCPGDRVAVFEAPSWASITADGMRLVEPRLQREQVVSVTPNPGTEAVYDLTVEGTPSFFANGLAVHNTPWHYADAWAWLREQKARHGMPLGEYVQPCWVPAERGAPGAVDTAAEAERLGLAPAGFGWVVPTFPERLSVPYLLRQRAEKGPSDFAAQYLLDPVSADTTVFPRTAIRLVRRSEVPTGLWRVMTVDPAISQKKWADFSALAVVGFDRDNALWVTDLRQGRWDEHQLIQEVYAAFLRSSPPPLVVGFEYAAFQRIYQHLFTAEGERRGHQLPMVKLERDARQHKNVRLQTLEPAWTQGHIHIVDDCPGLDELLYQAERWRRDADNLHDDLLDALADTYQLRQRPNLAARPAGEQVFLDDPALFAQAQFQQQLMTTRQQQGAPALGPSELRMAWLHAQVAQTAQDARDAAAVGAERW